MATKPRESRWNLRVADDTDSLVRRAAEETQRNLTEFVVDAAIAEAERTLADRTRFVLDEERWTSFVEALDQPVRDNPGLAKLFSKPTVFE
jgi:uncharacterized protein (DUF1778 family)